MGYAKMFDANQRSKRVRERDGERRNALPEKYVNFT